MIGGTSMTQLGMQIMFGSDDLEGIVIPYNDSLVI